MKKEWKKVKNRLDELERTDHLDWKKIQTRELNIVLANQHRGDRKHWVQPASHELNRRRHIWLIIISSLTLFFAIIGVIVGIYL